MKTVAKIYHFLGGVYFAIILIAAVAIFVIAGTFLESASQSHLYAARFTYDSPLFGLLLWGFFINILFAATRRWPFKRSHIPFLITHLGLLMVLGGVLMKHYYGVQGTLLLMEGGGSHSVQLPNTYALSVEKRGDASPSRYAVSLANSIIAKRDDGLTLHLAEFSPHSTEHLATWVKGSFATIGGLTPIPLVAVEDLHEYPVGGRVRLQDSNGPIWELYALRTTDTEDTIKKLEGQSHPLFGILEDSNQDVHLVAYDEVGKKWVHTYKKGPLDMLIAYDDGFGGYAVKIDLPFETLKKKTKAQANQLQKKLKHADEEGMALVPPLEAFRSACRKVDIDFSNALTMYLVAWNDSRSWLFPEMTSLTPDLQKVFAAIDWDAIAPSERTGCDWSVALFEKIGPELRSGNTPMEVLKTSHWPLLNTLSQEYREKSKGEDDPDLLLTLVLQQVFAAAAMQPEMMSKSKITPEYSAAMLSPYLRLFGIHLTTLIDPAENPIENPITLETSVVPLHQPMEPGMKLEDNIPRIIIRASKGKTAKAVSLRYDRSGVGLKWPILNGEYLVRYQPNVIEIPYHLRLRQARQINYPNSTQAYSYECDLIISDRDSGINMEKTISMNNVHETWDGYRFYLSSIAPADESAAKKVHIVVNRDPAKYWLTYPGAFILSCGIILLFAKGRRKEE